ncbi:MAG: pyruvate, phosphate dikinase [Candidatus Calescibacterium sp.]|nr:pyruvate, phosphate dikinase [Candidatus Calescibacterium sp.]MDW8132893.1 pyruvate, phosphate dikinase [Candidatus Calescibacterium sp.]
MKWIYFFDEGNASMRLLLGGKGANLAEMTNLGLPVPPGFTITTEVCKLYLSDPSGTMEKLMPKVQESIIELEKRMGRKFNDDVNMPLLVSVRSGAPASMPGMMDTILNVGLTKKLIPTLSKFTNLRFALDSYRRLLQMFGKTVLSIQTLEEIFDEYKKHNNKKLDIELDTSDLERIIELFEKEYENHGKFLPQDPIEQLRMSIETVFNSWNNERAKEYRRIYNIPEDWGTAVNVQAMVFGNMNDKSATGVAFTRNPSTGEKVLYGEYLVNAQGEDVVAGIRTPNSIIEMRDKWPETFEQLLKISEKLERHYKDMQDMEFTVEDGKLYMLQTRNGKRTAQASVKIATDLYKEGIINSEEMVMRVSTEEIEKLLHPQVDPNYKVKPITKGLNASPGAAIGKVVFDSKLAAELGEKGEKVILVRPETNPDDIAGLARSQGVLTARGGMTSHAAVVARGMGKPAVVGAEEININLKEKYFSVKETIVKEMDIISIDGSTGAVYVGEVRLIPPTLSKEFFELLDIADKIAQIGVKANADTPEDAKKAFEYGAKGIGLCRTEHMFMAEERLPIMQEMIIANTKEERQAALDKLLPMQREDFYQIFKEMKGYPVVIRLLDPPLHEFLPKEEIINKKIEEAKKQGKKEEVEKYQKMLEKAESLKEANPMLGFRGCRLGIVYPEINEMQVRAIFEAAVKLHKEGQKVNPHIMVPLVGLPKEIEVVKEKLEEVAKRVLQENNVNLEYKFGTMIEVPRACLVANKIAEYVDFFSFGTNDLTQMTFGYSRDDAEAKFIPHYLENNILTHNPFQNLDTEGVGQLMKIAIEKGRSVKNNLEVGICGEHGGDPKSIEFAYSIGVDYVSCSPFRVPVARLAAAQSTIKHSKKEVKLAETR